MANYDSIIRMAQRLITKKGQTVTLRSYVVTPPDPATPWEAGSTADVDQTPSAVFLDYAQDYIDGTVIKRGDQRVFIAAADLTTPPTANGIILRGAETWKIQAIGPLNPAGDPIMYDIQVRQ